MKNLPLKEAAWALAFVVVLLLVYVGAYLATVMRTGTFDPHSPDGFVVVAHYLFVNDVVGQVFAPIHDIDRSLRPNYWRFEEFFQEEMRSGTENPRAVLLP